MEDKPDLKELMHYGVGHLDGGNSGRYPWGSGEVPNQHNSIDFLIQVQNMKDKGFTYYDKETGKTYTGDAAIARSMCNKAKHISVSTAKFKAMKSIAISNARTEKYNRAKYLYDQGLGYTEIARKMGLPKESSARSLLKEDSKNRMNAAQATADYLKEQVDKKGMISVGKGTELLLGAEDKLNISREKMDTALLILEAQGYPTYNRRVANPTNKEHQTTDQVLCVPGTEYKDVYDNDKIKFIDTMDNNISRDNGKTFEKSFYYPKSMDSNRLMIRYAEDGGKEKDGVIEIRRGVDDLSLGESKYAQVRILVDDKKYLKGMAVYSDGKDMPKGVDVIFNTNKDKSIAKLDVLKDIKNDKDNPFGSTIKDVELGGQYFYTDKNGKKQLGLINKRSDEGDWSDWNNKLPSQFLAKQSTSLAKKQLDLAVKLKEDEYKEIMSLNNNTVKKFLLDGYAKDCDTEAVHLRGAALPRQQHQVILPLTTMKETEIYAPNYKDGEKVALIRYPHGGTFEIPILVVNNKNKQARDILGLDTKDCVGINSKVAERLSGADFDGDTVMVIPTNDKVKIKSTDPLKQLKEINPLTGKLEGFDPKTSYATTIKYDKDSDLRKEAIKLRKENFEYYDREKGKTLKGDLAIAKELDIKTSEVDSLIKNGEKNYYNKYGNRIKPMRDTQKQMGVISNLITDMTIKGASDEEIARAVKHSMVVIDAEKHGLDWQSSARENKIDALKRTYQIQEDGHTGGASTLISRAKSEERVLKRQGQPRINIKGNKDYDPKRPEGALIYKTADDKKLYYIDNKGVKQARTQGSTKMAETDDARTLISDKQSDIEKIYANFANAMKALANTARKSMITTKDIPYSKSAAETYKSEVDSLNKKLMISKKNAPRERQALILSNSRIDAKKEYNPSLNYDKEELRKLSQQELKRAREEVGAVRTPIDINDKEWEAIQAGAISKTKLRDILGHTDMDKVKERTTPRTRNGLSEFQMSRIKSLLNSGNYTQAQIAEMVGVSPASVAKYVKE